MPRILVFLLGVMTTWIAVSLYQGRYKECSSEDCYCPNHKLDLETGVHMIPHPDKKDSGGEDAYFISGNVMGVSDGVGGWRRMGIDSGLYSRKLMNEAKRAALENNTLNVLEILDTAYKQMGDVQGSATACIVKISDDVKTMEAINLGDSGFMIIRDDECENFRSIEQQHKYKHFSHPISF